MLTVSERGTCSVAYLGFWLGGLYLDRRSFHSFPSLPFIPPSLPLSFHPLPFILPFPVLLLSSLRSRLLKSSQGVWGNAVSSPSEVWGAAAAEVEFGAF